MSALVPLFHTIRTRLAALCPTLRPASAERLALLVTGILASRSCVLARIAAELEALAVTAATCPESIERRLRRTLSDTQLERGCYHALVQSLVDWPALLAQTGRILLILDESSKGETLHLLQLSLAYRGSAIPLSWTVWAQNVPLPTGAYWEAMDTILDEVAALLPPQAPVLVLADRAYDIPPVIDRLTARGWHWLIRCKANGSLRFCDAQGTEHELAPLLRQQLTPGRRWKGRGRLFKDAGWREASVVGLWARDEEAPLVVISDLPPRWELLGWYRRRAWTEPAFRHTKSKGWQWEHCQVQGVAHQQRLLLGMAWASVLTLLAGVEVARAALARQVQHRHFTRPQHARRSLFMLGLSWLPQWLAPPAVLPPWRLTDFSPHSWNDQWLAHQRYHLIFSPVRP